MKTAKGFKTTIAPIMLTIAMVACSDDSTRSQRGDTNSHSNDSSGSAASADHRTTSGDSKLSRTETIISGDSTSTPSAIKTRSYDLEDDGQDASQKTAMARTLARQLFSTLFKIPLQEVGEFIHTNDALIVCVQGSRLCFDEATGRLIAANFDLDAIRRYGAADISQELAPLSDELARNAALAVLTNLGELPEGTTTTLQNLQGTTIAVTVKGPGSTALHDNWPNAARIVIDRHDGKPASILMKQTKTIETNTIPMAISNEKAESIARAILVGTRKVQADNDAKVSTEQGVTRVEFAWSNKQPNTFGPDFSAIVELDSVTVKILKIVYPP